MLDRSLTASEIESRLERFSIDRLSVPWDSGPSYALPPEIDLERTRTFTRSRDRVLGGIERIHRRVLSDAALRDPKTKVLWAAAPAEDFRREMEVGGARFAYHMGDVMGTMTSVANEELLHSYSPNYATEFLQANIPAARGVRFLSPDVFADFERALEEETPDLLCLSGLNVNTRVLLRMAALARRAGVREIWLGAEAAIGPYRILDEAFDRSFFGLGEEYLYSRLVGDDYPGLVHPPAERMLAEVKWFDLDGDDRLRRVEFESLHIALRLGCTQTCVYCAERQKSGGVRPPTPREQLREVVEAAAARGVRKAYFVDPDFGRIWGPDVVEAVELLHAHGIRWSCLSNVPVLRSHGDFLIDHGLSSVYLGIESLAPAHTSAKDGRHTLSVLNRSWQDQDDTARVIREVADRGVFVLGLYILGNPGESLEAGRAGVDRLLELPVPISQFSTNQPFPGTAEFDSAAARGWIHNFDPDAVVYGRSVWAPDGRAVPPDEIEALFVETHRRFNHLWRPGGFVDHLRDKRDRRRARREPARARP